jgi:signal transduction histidine kinase
MQNVGLLKIRLTRDIPANHRAAEEAGTTLEVIRAYAEKRELADLLTRMQDATGRAAEIVQNMLQFSRKNTTKVISQNVGALIDRAITLAETDYDLKKKYDFRKIEIVRRYAPDFLPVYCDESKIQQVFLNILSNGAEAMSEKAGPQKPRFVIRTLKADDMIQVEIEDNGPGMDEETRRRVFEPFFTTKSAGVGTGLGLSVSYFIIAENHNGEMWVESVPGRGTTFFIRLPASGSN